jgi:hypothetical protein
MNPAATDRGLGEEALAKLYPDKAGKTKVGDCIETRDGRRWIVLPRNMMAVIGNRDGRKKTEPELREVKVNEACRVFGDAGSVLAEIAAHEKIRNSAGMPVVFIYDCGGHDPTHAVVDHGKGKRGIVGFCGAQPQNVSHCNTPDGGLCYLCAEYVEKKGNGYVVKANPKFQPFHHVLESAGARYCDYDDD